MEKLKIVNNMNNANAITHNGKFNEIYYNI